MDENNSAPLAVLPERTEQTEPFPPLEPVTCPTEEEVQSSDSVPPTEESVPPTTPLPVESSKETLRPALITLISTGMALLGLFAFMIYAVTLLDGMGELLSVGVGKLALGELSGGVDNVTVLPLPETEPLPEDTLAAPPVPSDNPPSETIAETVPPPTDAPVESSPTGEPPGRIAILSADISARGEHGLDLINETPYSPALTADSRRSIPTLAELYGKYGPDAPVVLILHTHGTEAYAPEGEAFTGEDHFRSHDEEKNILSVGKALSDALTARGIHTLHLTELFDGEEFTMAYTNAAAKIRQTLEEYPSISYIFDLHRDSIPSGEDTLRPVTEINGVAVAQMMFVVGTDHGGSGHTGWRDNLGLACRLQAAIFAGHQNVMRPINLRSASFNQQYTKGSLLVEVGAVGSTLTEAKNAAALLGDYLAEEIIG